MAIYNIVFLRGGRTVIVSTPWDMGFEEAKEHAKANLNTYRATRVEVRDSDTGKLMFHHPRTVKSANPT